MSEPTERERGTSPDIRGAIRALLEEDLTEPVLLDRLRALLPPGEEPGTPPTTDEATDHPGYQ
jgi:hypothetical protein